VTNNVNTDSNTNQNTIDPTVNSNSDSHNTISAPMSAHSDSHAANNANNDITINVPSSGDSRPIFNHNVVTVVLPPTPEMPVAHRNDDGSAGGYHHAPHHGNVDYSDGFFNEKYNGAHGMPSESVWDYHYQVYDGPSFSVLFFFLFISTCVCIIWVVTQQAQNDRHNTRDDSLPVIRYRLVRVSSQAPVDHHENYANA
jgi:hypothetical protein